MIAWLADKDAEALRCQKLLMEEEEAAQKRYVLCSNQVSNEFSPFLSAFFLAYNRDAIDSIFSWKVLIQGMWHCLLNYCLPYS